MVSVAAITPLMKEARLNQVFEMPKPNADKIRELRTQRGWTQEQLSEVAGISLKSVQRCEKGDPAALSTLQGLGSAFDLTVEALLAPMEKAQPKPKGPEKNQEPSRALEDGIRVHKLTRFRSGKSLLQAVGGAGTFHFDHVDPTTEEEVALLAEISGNLHDTLDCWSDCPPHLRVEMAFEMTKLLDRLAEKGFGVFAKSRRVRYTPIAGGEPIETVSAIVVVQRMNHPAIVRVSGDLEILPVGLPSGPVSFA